MYLLSFTSPGNAAVIKPSEVCVHTAKVMEELLPVYIDKVRMGLTTSPIIRERVASGNCYN